MKMVSAAKYAKAERELKGARSYGDGAQSFFSNIKEDDQASFGEDTGNKRLLILISSDRGLCGSIHSSLSKAARNIIATKPNDVEYKIVCIGDKCRGQLQRILAQNFLFTANEYGRTPPTFEDASVVANAVLNSGYSFDGGSILYNRFKSVVAFETKKLPLVTIDMIKASSKLGVYDSLDDSVLESYVEYSLAQLIYYAMKESACSEQSSRMTAMDGASKNAGEMIGRLTLQFNRTRQAVITRELIEIISGAACV